MVLVDIAGEGGVEDGVELSGLAWVPGVPSPVPPGPPGVIPRAWSTKNMNSCVKVMIDKCKFSWKGLSNFGF